MGHEVELPCSKESTTGTYLEPNKSYPHLLTLFP